MKKTLIIAFVIAAFFCKAQQTVKSNCVAGSFFFTGATAALAEGFYWQQKYLIDKRNSEGLTVDQAVLRNDKNKMIFCNALGMVGVFTGTINLLNARDENKKKKLSVSFLGNGIKMTYALR